MVLSTRCLITPVHSLGADFASFGWITSPEGGAANAAESARATDVNSLMDAVGASGVDLGVRPHSVQDLLSRLLTDAVGLQAEEESLRATNERQHAQAMAAQQSQGGYPAAERPRLENLVDQGALTEAVKRVGASGCLAKLSVSSN